MENRQFRVLEKICSQTIYKPYKSFVTLHHHCTSDAERSGHPIWVATPKTIEKIHEVSILNNHLLSARWVALLLTVDHNSDPIEFFRSFVTVDESWIQHNIPETKPHQFSSKRKNNKWRI